MHGLIAKSSVSPLNVFWIINEITLMLRVMPVKNILKSEVRRVVTSRKSVYPLVHIECVVNRYIMNFPWESIIRTEKSGLSTPRNQHCCVNGL